MTINSLMNFMLTNDHWIVPFAHIIRYPVDFTQPYTHARMLQNVPKYRLLSSTLAHIVRDKSVLDIGTGSGILALLSVAHGAKHVTAIERRLTCEIAKESFSKYPSSYRKIEVIEGDFFELDLGNVTFDVILSETIGYLGFEENIVPILYRACDRWSNTESVVLPSRLKVILEPVGNTIHNQYHQPHLELDISEGNTFQLLDSSPPCILGTPPTLQQKAWAFWQASCDAAIQAISPFFVAHISNEDIIINRVNSFWPRCLIPLDKTFAIKAGEVVRCELTLKPDLSGYFSIELSVQTEKDHSLKKFNSIDVAMGQLPDIPNDIDAVISQMRILLSSLNLLQST